MEVVDDDDSLEMQKRPQITIQEWNGNILDIVDDRQLFRIPIEVHKNLRWSVFPFVRGLPAELVLDIIDYLPVADTVSLALTCKTMTFFALHQLRLAVPHRFSHRVAYREYLQILLRLYPESSRLRRFVPSAIKQKSIVLERDHEDNGIVISHRH